MAFLIPTNAVQIARFANGLYGLQLGFASTNGIVSDVASGGLLPTFNNYYTLSFGSQATASVAQQILTNLGIVASPTGLSATAVSAALAYVTGQLNAAAPNARGAAVKAVVDLWSSISADPVNGPIYGKVATAWNNSISGAVQYAGAVNPDITVAQAAALPVAPQTYTLTTGVDTINGSASSSANNITGTANGSTATFTAGDTITGGNGVANALTITDLGSGGTWTPTQLSGVKVSGVQTATLSSSEAVTIDTTSATSTQGWTGLATLNVGSVGATSVTVPGTTAVTLSTSSAAATAQSVTGSAGVTATINGIADAVTSPAGGTGSASTITIGTTAAPATGPVAITAALNNTAAQNNINDSSTVVGGTTVAITQTIAAPTAVTAGNTATWTNTAGAVTVTGTSNTTSVTVTNPVPSAATATIQWGTLNPGLTAIVTPASGNTYTVTNFGTAQATAAQVAAAAAGSLAVPTLVASLPASGSVWGSSTGAASGSTTVITSNITAGTAQNTPTLTAGTGTSPTITAATGNVFGPTSITISDANSGSQTNGTITSISLTGLMASATSTYTINDNALSSLTLSGSAGGALVTINNNQTTPATTALAVTVSGLSGSSTVTNTLTDTSSTYKTIAITNSGTTLNYLTLSSKVSGITVSGSGNLSLGGYSTSLTSLAVSGSAGVIGGSVTGASKLTNITSSSSGPISFTLSETSTLAQGFASTGSGMDNITITTQARASITAGTATTNYLTWNAAAPTSGGLTTTGGTVTGFNTLGLAASATGTFNMANIGSAFTAIDIVGTTTGSLPITLTSVTPGTSLAIDTAESNTVTYTSTSTSGATTSVALTLGIGSTDPRITAGSGYATATSAGFTTSSVVLQDAASSQTVVNGVGTLTITANASRAGNVHTITTLSDTSLSTLNISGNAAVAIPNYTNDLSTSLTINNTSTSTGISTIGGVALTDNNLNSITFSGTGPTTIQNLNDTSAVITINQTSTGATTIGVINDLTISSLNVTGTAALTVLDLNINQTGNTVTTINNTSTGALTIGGTSSASGINGNTALTSLTIAGSGAVTLNQFSGNTTAYTVIDSSSAAVSIPIFGQVGAASQTFMNTGSGTFTVGATANNPTSLTSLTLIGNVAYSTPTGLTTAQTGATVTLGSLAATANPTTQNNQTVTAGSNQITLSAAPSTGVVVGEILSASDGSIPAGDYITNISGNTLTMYLPATATGTPNISYSGYLTGVSNTTLSTASATYAALVAGPGTTGEAVSNGTAYTVTGVNTVTNSSNTSTTIINLNGNVTAAAAAATTASNIGAPALASVSGVSDNANVSLIYGGANAITAPTFNLALTIGSTSATASSTTGVFVGETLSNANITSGTVITAISGSTVTLSLPATATAAAQAATALGSISISLGNGNNNLTDLSSTNPTNITVGTGTNTIRLPNMGTIGTLTGMGSAIDVVTFGTHTGGVDNVTVGTGAAAASTATLSGTTLGAFYNYSLIGMLAGDTISFSAASGAGSVTQIAQFAGTPQTSLSATIVSAAQSITTAFGTASFTYGGNTYLVYDTTAGTGASVVLVGGIHTFSNGTAGVVTLLT